MRQQLFDTLNTTWKHKHFDDIIYQFREPAQQKSQVSISILDGPGILQQNSTPGNNGERWKGQKS